MLQLAVRKAFCIGLAAEVVSQSWATCLTWIQLTVGTVFMVAWCCPTRYDDGGRFLSTELMWVGTQKMRVSEAGRREYLDL